MNFKYILKVSLFVFFCLVFVMILKIIFKYLNIIKEGLQNSNESLLLNSNDAFCKEYQGSSGALDSKCKKLTQNNCNSTSCCIWTSDNQCVAGGKSGPTFNSDSKGKTISLDYYFQNKCYGKNCQS